MPTLRIPPGVVRGESRASIPGRWYDANLIRWSQGLMKPVGGWERITQNPLASVPRAFHVWNDLDGERQMGVLCDANVYRQTKNQYFDITPAGFADANSTSARGYGSGDFGIGDYGRDTEDRGSGLGATDPKNPTKFSNDNWNDEFLFSSSADGRIWVWDPKNPMTPPAQALNVPSLIQGFIVTDEHHLMIFGSSGQRNRVAWSGQGNRTDFDYTAVTGQAGFFDLEGAGKIVSWVKLPSAILIFTTSSVWLCRYIGQPYYYSFNKIAEGCTPISPQAIAVAGSKVYWPGARNFWKFEGGVVTPLPCSLGLDPFENLDRNAAPRRMCAGFNGAYPEVWFYYPEKGQNVPPAEIENNRYLVYNFDENWWADGYQMRSMYGFSPLDLNPVAAHPGGWLYNHEVGYLDEGQPRTNRVWAEVSTISFEDGASNYDINQLMIDSPQGPESVRFSFRGSYNRGGQVYDFGTYIPRADGYVDTDFSANDFSMRIEGMVDAPWALGAIVFNDVKKRGPR